MTCHDLPALTARSRAGYWHFERVHREVLDRAWTCTRCHKELAPFTAGAHRIDRIVADRHLRHVPRDTTNEVNTPIPRDQRGTHHGFLAMYPLARDDRPRPVAQADVEAIPAALADTGRRERQQVALAVPREDGGERLGEGGVLANTHELAARGVGPHRSIRNASPGVGRPMTDAGSTPWSTGRSSSSAARTADTSGRTAS